MNFAHTWEDLAIILTQRIGVTVSRKSLQNWRNPRLRPELEHKWPRDRADGRKDVSAWIRFVVDNGLHRADEVAAPDQVAGERSTVRDWKMFREELHCEEAMRRIARSDRLLLVASDLEVPIGATFAAINSKLALFAPRTARFMVMKRDEAAAEDTLRDEMDAVVKDLNCAQYVESAVESVVSELPPEEREALRGALEKVLRRIGQSVLQNAIGETPTSDTPAQA